MYPRSRYVAVSAATLVAAALVAPAAASADTVAPTATPTPATSSTTPSSTAAAPAATPATTAPTPASPAAAQNASGMPWLNGVFAHDTARVTRFEDVTGRKVDQLGVFPNRGSWDSILGDTWWLDTAPAGFTGTLDVAVPLWQADGDLATAAAGGYDAQWQELGRLIEAKYPGSTVRPGWEFNIGGWDHRATPENVEQWKEAFRRASTALRAGGPSLLVVFNPNKGKGDSLPDAASAYPGDEFVDIIGIDAYDWWPGYTEASWPEHRDSDQGWDFWVDFARANGKKFTVPEFGVAPGNANGGGDNPFYIDTVLDFLAAEHAKDGIVHSAVYFDEPADYIRSSLAEGQAPAAAAAFKSKTAEIASAPVSSAATAPTDAATAASTATSSPTGAPAAPPAGEPSEGAQEGAEVSGWGWLKVQFSGVFGRDGDGPESPPTVPAAPTSTTAPTIDPEPSATSATSTSPEPSATSTAPTDPAATSAAPTATATATATVPVVTPSQPATSPTDVPAPDNTDGGGWALIRIPMSWLMQWGRDDTPDAPSEPPPTSEVDVSVGDDGGSADTPSTDPAPTGEGYAPAGTDAGGQGDDTGDASPATP